MEKILDIKNLKVSFRTNNGTVKAVRGINLQLDKGQTLAIVGESGSGKSVTAKAILGILSPNSIVESGEIIYDGKDLLKISEEEFHNYRGNRVSMIFQDPMSSLNPIMTIGKQLTEAMLLNGKANQKIAQKEFKLKTNALESCVKEAAKKKDNLDANEITKMVQILKKFSKNSSDLEKQYEDSISSANLVLKEISYLLKNKNKFDKKEAIERLNEIYKLAVGIDCEYFHRNNKEELVGQLNSLKIRIDTKKGLEDEVELSHILDMIISILEEKMGLVKPDFFAMGYYSMFHSITDSDISNIEKLNKTMQDYLHNNFMNQFLILVSEGIKYSSECVNNGKIKAMKELEQALQLFKQRMPTKKEAVNTAKHLCKLVEQTIDPLTIRKEHLAYTFMTSLTSGIDTYYNGIKNNEKNDKLYKKQLKKYNKMTARGAKREKVETPSMIDLELAHDYICQVIMNLIDSYEKQIREYAKIDNMALASDLIDYLKIQVFKRVYKVTNQMARTHATSLMEEVGIADAKKRFDQFPFQFSGGMRQRIVIAIALAANPDILVCDEPTTALDVTIQSQILELINSIKKERQLSIIFITHDLGVVANMADNIAVMYAGKIVEYGNVDEIFYDPKHPYTWALLSSMPDLDTKEKLEAIPGTPPNMIHPPVGDVFAARNKYAMEIDFCEEPPLFEVTKTHYAATWLLHPYAPKVEPPKIVTERIKRMKDLEVNSNG
jgi:oligopeptide/dipeptide ABC transporter ATP-binding protein